MAECSHELYTRWLDADQSVSLTELRETTLGEGVRSNAEIESAARARLSGRPVSVPRASSLSTMQTIRDRAKKRSDAIRAAADGKKEKAFALFRTPIKGSPPAPLGQSIMAPGAARAAKIRYAMRDALSPRFPTYFQALMDLERLQVSLDEAKLEGHLGSKLADISLSAPKPAQALAHAMILRWRAQSSSTEPPAESSSARSSTGSKNDVQVLAAFESRKRLRTA